MIEREYEIMSKLGQNTSFPVPRTYFLDTSDEVCGTPYFACEYVDGRFYKDCRMEKAPNADARKASFDSLIRNTAHFHSIDFESIGLGEYGKKGGYLARQTKVWTSQYRAAAEATNSKNEDIEKLISWLPTALPEDDDVSTLVHGDLRVDNCIFDADTNEVKAVLDWELSTIGHPGADIALLTSPYHTPGTMPVLGGLKGLSDRDLSELGIPTEAEFVHAYDAQVDHDVITNLDYYQCFACFRMASILQGVYARSLAGNASSKQGLEIGALAGVLAKLGLKHMANFEKGGGRIAKVAGDGSAFISGSKRSFSSTSRSMATAASPMNYEDIKRGVEKFMEEEVIPIEMATLNRQNAAADKWTNTSVMDGLREKAKKQDLWNLFLPDVSGLSNLEYASLAEIMGNSLLGSECFNCQAPDTGNMEVLHMFGTDEQKSRFLDPLMEGRTKSAFLMTEPAVASSDATNMAATIEVENDEVVINGVKWWSSGAGHPKLDLLIVMGKDIGVDGDTPRHRQHSMVLVPASTPGVEIVRPLSVFGYLDAPHGHCEVKLTDVRVPRENFVLGQGEGFTIAQARLGPGRIHHCMRMIGMAERAMKLMCERADTRTPFGKPLSEQGVVLDQIARSRCEIDSARLLVLNAAKRIDEVGAKGAKNEIAEIKIVVPQMACNVLDRAIQIHGGGGVSSDFPLAYMYSWARVLRLADGPDEVHIASLGKQELRSQRLKR